MQMNGSDGVNGSDVVPETGPPLRSSADEMGRGLLGVYLAGLVFFLAVAAMMHEQTLEGYGMLVICAVGMVIGARHMREAMRLAAEEDEARDEAYRRWVDSVNGLVAAVEEEERKTVIGDR